MFIIHVFIFLQAVEEAFVPVIKLMFDDVEVGMEVSCANSFPSPLEPPLL